jgi:hypothetical protein
LKFHLANQEDLLPVTVTLCPEQFSNNNDDFCGDYDDDDDKAGIKLSWGGGHEDGAVVSVPSVINNTFNAFLVVHHMHDQNIPFEGEIAKFHRPLSISYRK